MGDEWKAIEEYIEKLGAHEGACQFPLFGQGCAVHLSTLETRRAAAREALGKIKGGLGLGN